MTFLWLYFCEKASLQIILLALLAFRRLKIVINHFKRVITQSVKKYLLSAGFKFWYHIYDRGAIVIFQRFNMMVRPINMWMIAGDQPRRFDWSWSRFQWHRLPGRLDVPWDAPQCHLCTHRTAVVSVWNCVWVCFANLASQPAWFWDRPIRVWKVYLLKRDISKWAWREDHLINATDWMSFATGQVIFATNQLKIATSEPRDGTQLSHAQSPPWAWRQIQWAERNLLWSWRKPVWWSRPNKVSTL